MDIKSCVRWSGERVAEAAPTNVERDGAGR